MTILAMKDFILFMHDDAASASDGEDGERWAHYLDALRASGQFLGGSSMGDGQCFRRSGEPEPLTTGISGFIRVSAESIEAARSFLDGNPVYESGGTVEIRELPRD